MKNILKRISSLTLALALVVALAMPASAAEVIFKGSKKGDIQFKDGSAYTATDLFGSFKDVMPGDVREQTVSITNMVRGSVYIKVYMKAVPHSEKNGLTYSETYEEIDGKDQKEDIPDGKRDETVESMEKFLNQLDMTVVNQKSKKTIFDGTAGETDGLSDWKYLGDLKYKESMNLLVTLGVPITMGNEFAYRVGEVDWVFKADIIEGDKLIQTGQLNWPIPVLGTLGAGLIVFGIFAMRKKKKEEDA